MKYRQCYLVQKDSVSPCGKKHHVLWIPEFAARKGAKLALRLPGESQLRYGFKVQEVWNTDEGKVNMKSRQMTTVDTVKTVGFTVIELMIVTAIILFLAVGTLTLFGGCRADWKRAEKDAKAFASKIPGFSGEVSCMHKDSDGDGYCRCTAFFKDGRRVTMECGCENFCIVCAEGCSEINSFRMSGKRQKAKRNLNVKF